LFSSPFPGSFGGTGFGGGGAGFFSLPPPEGTGRFGGLGWIS